MMKVSSTFALPILLAAVFLAGSCASNDFSKDPVKWWFVSGDGSWDIGSRKWTVYLARGETKSATFRLQNTSSEDHLVLVQMEGATDYILRHLESTSIVKGDNVVGVRAGSSTDITLSASADTFYSAISPRKYVIDLGWSTTEAWPRQN